MLQKHSQGKLPLTTSLDLYQELEAATPASLQYLLHDLFKANTFWNLEASQATVKQTKAGTWQVTLEIQARKVVVNESGVETEVPVNDWIEVGVFAPAKGDKDSGKMLYLKKHHFNSNKMVITVTVPGKPARSGIDPRNLLIDTEMYDNTRQVVSNKKNLYSLKTR